MGGGEERQISKPETELHFTYHSAFDKDLIYTEFSKNATTV